MVIVVMGVSGAGKTTVGRALAETLGWPFYDGDDVHPPANIEKMRRGVPLTDADRRPWLEALRALIARQLQEGRPAVVACSALKRSYRDVLRRAGEGVRFVHLAAHYETIRRRLETRRGHFFDPKLLQSQFDDLETPYADEALILEATRPVSELVHAIITRWNLQGRRGAATPSG